MEVIRGLLNIKPKHQGCSLTIGKFDGVHLGHQNLLNQLIEYARTQKTSSMVMIFEPAPADFFSSKLVQKITPLREKLTLFRRQGLDYVLILPFNEKLRNISAEDFVSTILVQRLAIKKIWVGSDFVFGTNRSGDYNFLEKKAGFYRFQIGKVEKVSVKNYPITSSNIRRSLVDLDLYWVQQMLGRDFSISGKVVRGKQLGRSIGYATANLAIIRKNQKAVLQFLPKGVYGVQLNTDKEVSFAAANLGIKPTVSDEKVLTLETHCFDLNRELYGERVDIRFLCYIRGEKKFADLKQLQQQIAEDVEVVKKRLNYKPSDTVTCSSLKKK